MKSVSGNKGFALVLVLWVLSLLTIMAGSFTLTMRRESALIEGIKQNAQGQSLAESAIALAQLMLINPELSERWHADGSIYQINFNNASVRIQLISELGKIDINSANQKLLTAVMSHAPIEEKQQTKVLNAILDWRDADDETRPDGAEKNEYKHAKLSYVPRNKRFRSIEELQMILGMDSELYQWLQPLITVYSGQEVELKLATKAVLQVLPELDSSRIDEFVAARLESAKNGLPAPAFPVTGTDVLDEGTSDLSSEPEPPPEGEEATPEEVETGVVEIIAETQVENEPNSVLSLIIEKSDTGVGSPFKVLKWQRNYASEKSLFADEMNELLVGQYAEPQFNN